MALKLARVATGRHRNDLHVGFVSRGLLDAISIGGEAIFRQQMGPLLPERSMCRRPTNTTASMNAQPRRLRHDVRPPVEYVLEKEEDIAAVIAEPIRSTPYIPKPEYWQIIRKACDRHGALRSSTRFPTPPEGPAGCSPARILTWSRHARHRQGARRRRLFPIRGADRP